MIKMISIHWRKIITSAICFSLLGIAGCGGSDSSKSSDDLSKQTLNEKAVRPTDVTIDKTIKIDTVSNFSEKNKTFEGWGTSLCWWANRLGYSDSLAQQSADAFYGEDGLRLNIMRYNIGGGDDPEHDHITRTDSAVPGWLYWNEEKQEYVYNYDADHDQLNVLKRCYEAAGDDALVEVFSNSPPYFMTVSGCSSGNSPADEDNLKNDSYEDFAEYLAHVIKYIQQDMGITVDSVSPMNEPDTNFWWQWSNKQEGCHFDSGDSQSKIIKSTAEKLEAYGLDNVIVSASDETKCSSAANSYYSYSDEARDALGRINAHTYDTNGIDALGELCRDHDIKLWMSETDGSGTGGTDAGEMGSAIWFGQKIIYDINRLTPSAWIMWQVIDSHISKDGYNGKIDGGMVNTDGGFWGTAVADHDNDTIILTQKYYGFGQFTRYIRPGCELLTIDDESIAAYDKENKRLTVVSVNASAENITADFDLSKFTKIGDSVSTVRTSGSMENGEHWAELEDIFAYETGFVAELKSNSITTFIINDVEI